MLSFKQREAVRRILKDEQSSIAASWYAGFLASGYKIRLQEAAQDPDTLYIDEADYEAFLAEIEREAELQISDLLRAKILAGLMIFTTDRPYVDLPAFIDLANLTNAQDPPIPNVFNPANVTECGLALLEIAMIDTGLQPSETIALQDRFSAEIRGYWGAVLSSEGAAGPIMPFTKAIVRTPDPLADPMLFEVMADRTEEFAGSIRNLLWRYAVESFNQIVTLTDENGQPPVTADQMTQFMTAFAGSL